MSNRQEMPDLKKFLLLFLIPSLLCGCFQKPWGTKHAHYELGISLRAPESWQRADISSAATVSSMAVEDGQGGLAILTQNFDISFRAQLKATSEMNYPVIEKGPLLFSKYKTNWFRSIDERTSKVTYVLKADEGRVFSIVCTAPSINFTSYRSVFDRIARSFRTF